MVNRYKLDIPDQGYIYSQRIKTLQRWKNLEKNLYLFYTKNIT